MLTSIWRNYLNRRNHRATRKSGRRRSAWPTAFLSVAGLEPRIAPAVLFSDSVNRANVVNNVFGLGALDNFAGTSAPQNHAHFYDPNFPTNNNPAIPVGADIVSNALQGRGLDYGGVQFAATSSNNSGENIGQDLNIKADLFVPKTATGQETQAGIYFRARSAPPGDGIIGGSAGGYWVRLNTTGEVVVKLLGAVAGFSAATARPTSFNSTIVHTMEVAFQGTNLQVSLDGNLQTFLSALQGGQVTTVNIPPTAGSNDGTAGVAYSSEPNRGEAGGERFDNIIVSTYSSLTGLPVSNNFTSALDFGDAPDTGTGHAAGNYNTSTLDNGPSHVIVAGLKMGALIDGENDAAPNVAANGDDTTGSADEDGVSGPVNYFIGVAPSVQVNVTNTTGTAATLYGWIDYNGNGVFDNATERASVAVPTGTVGGSVTLNFPVVPAGSAANTYARFRLSTDAAAANPVGAATDGEVEDTISRIPPAKLSSIQVNDGSVQRSMVTSFKVAFDSHVTFSGAATAAFSLVNVTNANASVTLAAGVNDAGSGTVVTLSFTGGAVNGASLSDGRYTFKILASGFSGTGFDGNGNGTAQGSPADDFTEVGSPISANKLFRLFGDSDGDGTVAASDFIQFRLAFGGSSATFDFDNDGAVAASDFIQFRLRFGGSI